jgi:signal transduction histidine kinase/DNA-binding response OmpR family regulator/ligand-binding sensor domain-containing protein
MKPATVKTKGRFWVQWLFIIIFLLIIPLKISSSQDINIDDYIGLNYVKNYSPEEYDLEPQNWDIAQDNRGIIYVANHGGLLEYDGVSWRKIGIPNLNARSLAVDSDGTIYVGGNNEFGFLVPDSNGTLQYKSLVNHLQDHQKNFANVWRTHNTKEGIYFQTTKYLFRWNARQKKMDVWQAEGKGYFLSSFYWNGKLLIQQKYVGLMQIVNDSLKLIQENEILATVKIYLIAQLNIQKLLIVTRENGFYIYDYKGNTITRFPTMVDSYLKEKELYHGIQLSNGDFALATSRGGLLIVDQRGKLKKIFTKDSGLQKDSVKYVFEDFQGNLWLALEKGISKIEYSTPISIYDEDRSNLPGLVLSIIRHDPGNDLYVGTTHGLYMLDSPSSTKFRHIPINCGQCWSLLSVNEHLLAASLYGVFQVENNMKWRIMQPGTSLVLNRSPKNPNRVWVGTSTGLISLTWEKENGQWKKEDQFQDIVDAIRTIGEDSKGNLWLGPMSEGVLKIDFPVEGTTHPYVVSRYDTSQGLPPGAVRVFTAAGHTMFGTSKGLYRFDGNHKKFIPDKTLGDESVDEDSREIWRIAVDNNQNIWFNSKKRNFQAILQPDGIYVSNKSPLRIPRAQVNCIYPDPGGDIIWFGSNDGLIRYDTTVEKKYHHDFSTYIRKVVVNGKLVFDGYKTGIDAKRLFPTIAYKDRNLRFEFAAPFFEAESRTEYQCFLEGYDKAWSDWNNEPQMVYTNLDAGRYRFRVRAQNVYETQGREDVYKFKILPPWYKTWWAFSIYAIAVILGVFFIVKWRSWRLEQEKQRLEQVVKNRTKEINHKNRQLEEQSEKLKEMDKVKSRFFANISHEFRTPLTLIMGPLEQMLSNCRDREMERKMSLMLRNSQRLLNLINQLLDLSKLDSGRMKLQAVRQNIVPFLKGMKDSFDLAAQQHEVDLIFHTEKENITLYFDMEKMENVMCNLLINAIKFTPPGGKVTVSVTAPSPEVVEISVRDTGIGIPRDQLEHIFDRFFQVEEPSRAYHLKGTGIGLALTKELVNLHHGRLDVHSRVGEPSGTEFIIQLPMGKEHLKPEEIVEIVEGETPTPCKSPVSMLMEEEISEIETKEPMDTDEPGEERAHEKDIILVVEDSADVREYIRGSLEPAYTAMEAKDGEEGINKAKEIIPDLIISDVMMPGINGFELCRVLKKDVLTSHIPIILLTAKAGDEDVLEGLATGADDYITKPFNTKILCARIKNLIDLRRQLQQNLNREMTLQPVKTSVSEVDKEFFKDMHKVIEKNLSDSDFNVEQLGKKLYMSRATLYRKIMALTGETPTEYIRTYRLKRGAELLKNNYGTVLEVALEVGFSSSAYFTKCFKEKFHQLPSEFQAAEGQ